MCRLSPCTKTRGGFGSDLTLAPREGPLRSRTHFCQEVNLLLHYVSEICKIQLLILEHWARTLGPHLMKILSKEKITDVIGEGRMLSLRSQGRGPAACQRAWTKEWGNLRNEHNTCETAWLFQWEGSVITWRGGNGRDVRRRFKREGTHVYPRFIPVDVRQKSHQYCKAIRNQWKINK